MLKDILTKNKKGKTYVEIVESEKEWGERIEETIKFNSKEEAEKFCKDYNNKHNPISLVTPDWYMYARIKDNGPLCRSWGMLR